MSTPSPSFCQGQVPRFIPPMHGGEDYSLTNSHDLCRQIILPTMPDEKSAREIPQWKEWAFGQPRPKALPELGGKWIIAFSEKR